MASAVVRARVVFLLASLCFFASGMTGLAYQVIWFKRFAHAWGSSGLAMGSVVASFLFGLGAGALLAPKEPGGLNIEGLCPTPDGGLLIGFRNPIPRGRALIVPLKNPGELIEGRAARFGEPALLDLGGRGVRDLARVGNGYLIIGGSFEGGGKFHLYSWAGGTNSAQKISEAKFKGANPEALLTYPGTPEGEFQILSDDGTLKISGEDCKLIKDPARKWFRSFWLRLD